MPSTVMNVMRRSADIMYCYKYVLVRRQLLNTDSIMSNNGTVKLLTLKNKKVHSSIN
jgi:hypothetical protein